VTFQGAINLAWSLEDNAPIGTWRITHQLKLGGKQISQNLEGNRSVKTWRKTNQLKLGGKLIS